MLRLSEAGKAALLRGFPEEEARRRRRQDRAGAAPSARRCLTFRAKRPTKDRSGARAALGRMEVTDY